MEKYKKMVEGMAAISNPRIDKDKTALVCIDLVNDGSDDNGVFKKFLNYDISLIQEIEPNVVKLVNTSKKAGIPVIGVQTIYDFDYITAPMKERFEAMGIKGGLAPKGAWGSEIIPKIKNLGLDLILVKSHYSAFSPEKTFAYKPGNQEIEEYMKLPASEDSKLKAAGKRTMLDFFGDAKLNKNELTSLDSYLKSKGIDTLIITGASTHVCVDSTVAAASERGYKLYEPIDGVAAEGIPGEGFDRHYTYMSNHGMFKSELTTSKKLLEKLI